MINIKDIVLKQELMPSLFDSNSFFNTYIKEIFRNIVDSIYGIKSDFEIQLIDSLEISYSSENDYYYISPIDFINKVLAVLNINNILTIDINDEDIEEKISESLYYIINKLIDENNIDNRYIYDIVIPYLKITYNKLGKILDIYNINIDKKIKEKTIVLAKTNPS